MFLNLKSAGLKKVYNRLFIFTLYFMEGYPFSVVWSLGNVYFVKLGMSLKAIGLTSIYSLFWSFKFLWSPFIDLLKTRRFWIVLTEIFLFLLSLAMAINASFFVDKQRELFYAVILFGSMAFVSATHDIAIDGYYLEILSKKLQQFYSGFRVLAYRIAMLFVGSVVLFIAGEFGWKVAFFTNASIIFVFLFFHLFYLPKRKIVNDADFRDLNNNNNDVGHDVKKSTNTNTLKHFNLKNFLLSFYTFIKQERFLLVLVFLIFYKFGDNMMLKMATPFLMRDLGITVTQMSFLAGTIGKVMSILGAIAGGIIIAKFGLKKGIYGLTVFQGVVNILYVYLAVYKPGLVVVALVHGVETFASSITAVGLVNYIMSISVGDFKSTHFAIGTGLLTLGGVIAGSISGFLASSVGYAMFFFYSFLAALIPVVLMFFVPFRD